MGALRSVPKLDACEACCSAALRCLLLLLHSISLLRCPDCWAVGCLFGFTRTPLWPQQFLNSATVRPFLSSPVVMSCLFCRTEAGWSYVVVFLLSASASLLVSLFLAGRSISMSSDSLSHLSLLLLCSLSVDFRPYNHGVTLSLAIPLTLPTYIICSARRRRRSHPPSIFPSISELTMSRKVSPKSQIHPTTPSPYPFTATLVFELLRVICKSQRRTRSALHGLQRLLVRWGPLDLVT